MKSLGQASDDVERRLEQVLPAWAGPSTSKIEYEAATVPVASPIRRAVDWAGYRVRAGDRTAWAKILYPDMKPFVNVATSVAAARQAGDIGIAPRVLAEDIERGVVLFENLEAPWRWARVDDLTAVDAQQSLLDRKRQFHRTDLLAHDRDVFAEVSGLISRCRREGAALPEDIDWMERNLDHTARALHAAGSDRVPAHGDGTASNVLCNDAGDFRLVDFDAAGNMDPLFDVAATLVELCEFDDEWERGVELFSGRASRDLVARCRLYGIVDDLAWGFWGLLAAALSPRREVEFFKYGQWRLLRARMNLHDPRFEMWLRHV